MQFLLTTNNQQHRRRADLQKATSFSGHRLDRYNALPPRETDHMRGWVRFGLSLPLLADASAEMRAGYAEARNNTIDILTAQEHAA